MATNIQIMQTKATNNNKHVTKETNKISNNNNNSNHGEQQGGHLQQDNPQGNQQQQSRFGHQPQQGRPIPQPRRRNNSQKDITPNGLAIWWDGELVAVQNQVYTIYGGENLDPCRVKRLSVLDFGREG